jgi:hypothetical protein
LLKESRSSGVCVFGFSNAGAVDLQKKQCQLPEASRRDGSAAERQEQQELLQTNTKRQPTTTMPLLQQQDT